MLADEIRTRRYALRPDVVATVLEDGAVLLDLESKYFYRLNASGWFIVQAFENGASLHEVLASCRVAGALPADEHHIDALMEALLHDRLIEETEDEEPLAERAAQLSRWTPPQIEKQSQPLQKVIISAFDPSVPLVE